MKSGALALMFVASVVSTGMVRAAEPARGFRESYSPLMEHNIFLRDRAKPTMRPTTEPTRPARSAEQTFVLNGVVIEPAAARAFLEDRSDGRLLKLSVGDEVARGKIVQIEIDAVAYEQDGQRTWVNVGSDLTGTTALPMVSVAPTTQGATPVEAGAAPANNAVPVNGANLSVLERMRLRRQQESGRP